MHSIGNDSRVKCFYPILFSLSLFICFFFSFFLFLNSFALVSFLLNVSFSSFLLILFSFFTIFVKVHRVSAWFARDTLECARDRVCYGFFIRMYVHVKINVCTRVSSENKLFMRNVNCAAQIFFVFFSSLYSNLFRSLQVWNSFSRVSVHRPHSQDFIKPSRSFEKINLSKIFQVSLFPEFLFINVPT